VGESQRTMLVMVHTSREQALDSARLVIGRLCAAGITVRVTEPEAGAIACPGMTVVPPGPDAADGAELVIVLGGDGSLLRAAEFARPVGTPLIGVNLGHVGFLAEAEVEGLAETVDKLIDQRYAVEARMTVDVVARANGAEIARTWALNEATVEKGARERMVEVVIEIDGRPLSRWGCDGVVCATPTGSTAYAFSAGGPVVWPGVEALLVVPISAHALFAPPMVVSPEAVLAVELLYEGPRAGAELAYGAQSAVKARDEGGLLATGAQGPEIAGPGIAGPGTAGPGTASAGTLGAETLTAETGGAVMWCDGRRRVDLPPGARVEVRRGSVPVLLARVHGFATGAGGTAAGGAAAGGGVANGGGSTDGGQFTDRLVAKFGLPVAGWRGRSSRGG
jgi:NAD+ kinase